MTRIVSSTLLSAPLHARVALGVLAAGVIGLASVSAGDIKFKKCPEAVQQTIRENLNGGKVDKIKMLKIEDHVLYLVDVDLKGFRDMKLQISGTGVLRKSVEEMKKKDLPIIIRDSIDRYFQGKINIEDVERVYIDGKWQYHVEIEQPHEPDRVLIFEADGTISSLK